MGKIIFWHQGRKITFDRLNVIFKKKIFWVHVFRGPVGGIKYKNFMTFFQHLLNLVLGKFEGPSYHGSLSNHKNAEGGGPPRPNPMGDRVNQEKSHKH